MNAQRQERRRQQHNVNDRLPDGLEVGGNPVGIQIADKEHHGEEDQAGGPHRRGATQRGQQLFRCHRLHDKEEESAQENR